MIKNYLIRDLQLGKLHKVYLINTDDLAKSLKQITDFLSEYFYQNQETLKHPEFMLVQKMEGNVKNISIDQIRSLQNFLYKTSVISGQKTAVICGADLMNLNAANSCLKLLEDTPKNTHIFLVTTHAASILPTIRSRCAKINYNFSTENVANVTCQGKLVDDYYVIPCLRTTNIEKHLEYLKDFAGKDRRLWIEFTANVQALIARVFKSLSGQGVELSTLETTFLKQVRDWPPEKILEVYDKVIKLTDDTVNFDLDLKASYILLINSLSESSRHC